MSKSGPTRYRVPAALFLHHVQGHDRKEEEIYLPWAAPRWLQGISVSDM
jgi:hypothetical protein